MAEASSDVAAGLMFTATVAIQNSCDLIGKLLTGEEFNKDRVAAIRELARRAAEIRRFVDVLDRGWIADLAKTKKEMALALAYAFGRAEMLPDVVISFNDHLRAGHDPTIEHLQRTLDRLNEFQAQVSEYVAYCTKHFARPTPE